MEEIFSTKFNHGSRNFFFDIRQKADTKSIYLTITERKVIDGKSFVNQVHIYEGEVTKFKNSIEFTLEHFDNILAGNKSVTSGFTAVGRTDVAYLPWSDEDDEHLQLLYNKGTKIRDMAELFGRTTGAIFSRLKKLGIT